MFYFVFSTVAHVPRFNYLFRSYSIFSCIATETKTNHVLNLLFWNIYDL